MISPNDFHDHLDACRQCRENPFNLCRVGQGLFLGVARDRESAQNKNPQGPAGAVSSGRVETPADRPVHCEDETPAGGVTPAPGGGE